MPTFSQVAFPHESLGFEQSQGALILGIYIGLESMQTQSLEREANQQLQGFGGVATTPCGPRQRDPQFGASMRQVDIEQGTGTDHLVCLPRADTPLKQLSRGKKNGGSRPSEPLRRAYPRAAANSRTPSRHRRQRSPATRARPPGSASADPACLRTKWAASDPIHSLPSFPPAPLAIIGLPFDVYQPVSCIVLASNASLIQCPAPYSRLLRSEVVDRPPSPPRDHTCARVSGSQSVREPYPGSGK